VQPTLDLLDRSSIPACLANERDDLLELFFSLENGLLLCQDHIDLRLMVEHRSD